MKQKAVRDVLLNLWDPLRISRRNGRLNEYDRYISALVAMARASSTAGDYELFLDFIIDVEIGLDRPKGFSSAAGRALARLSQ